MKKSLIRRCLNRVFSLLARFAPGATTVRPWLHRARGIKVGRDVFIGDDVYLDNEYPECIEIQDEVQISIRAVIIAHTRGSGKVILEKECFVGPHVVVASGGGRTVRIGQGAVISAGCIVTKNVPPRALLVPAAARVAGFATVPLPKAGTMEQFWAGLTPVRPPSEKQQTKSIG